MTIKDVLLGNRGMGGKPFERQHVSSPGSYSYPGPMYPPYSPPQSYHPPQLPPMYHGPPAPPAIYKHYSFSHSAGKGGGGGAAISALTLLSFLFFLNILQQCLKDQMTSMTPQVMVMATGRTDVARTENPVTNEPEKVYTLIDGAGRLYPEYSQEKHLTKVKIVKVDSHGDPIRKETIFINAMADGNEETIMNDKNHK